MAVSITITPTYPIAGRKLTGAISLSGGGNYARIWCTDAPVGSALQKQLEAESVSRIQVFEGGTQDRWEFTPEVGGVYVLTSQEYQRGVNTTGGGWHGAPTNNPSETKIGSEAALSVQVGQRLAMALGGGADTATLAMHVFGNRIRPTTVADHGEKTPAILNANSPRAKIASLTPAVLTQVAAIQSMDVDLALGTLSTLITDFIDKYNAHRVTTSSSIHNAADSDNEIKDAFRSPTSPKGVVASVAECLRIVERHMRNDSGSGDGSASYHQLTSTNRIDWTNLVPEQLKAVPDISRALVAYGALVGAYEAHLTSIAVHGSVDVTNVLTSQSAFVSLHRAWADVIKIQSPTVPATANTGAALLLAHGCTEE